MCFYCYHREIEEFGPVAMTPAILAAGRAAKAAEYQPAIHIAADDYNLEDGHLAFCREEAERDRKKRDVTAEIAFLDAFDALDYVERYVALAWAHGYLNDDGSLSEIGQAHLA